MITSKENFFDFFDVPLVELGLERKILAWSQKLLSDQIYAPLEDFT